MTTTGTREHGTRARYAHGPGPGNGPGCRCDECTAANRAAARQRERAILYGRWQPFADAGPAREHVQALARHGIGRRRAAELAGMSAGAMSRLLYGGPGSRPPTRRIRPQTAAAILAIRPSADLVAPGVLVGAAGTRHRVQALVASGWSQAQLAGQLMTSPGHVGALLRQDRVTARMAAAVRGLYDRLWSQPPPQDDHPARIAASRARNYAAARGWAPPMAWDDEELDKPDGRAAEGWRRRTRTRRPSAELAEDAAELFRQDYTREQAAGRLGVTKGALERALGRAQNREAASRLTAQAEHEAQRARFAEASAAAEAPARQAEAG
jgi:transcriptional regulator with XRE-family HTH domain